MEGTSDIEETRAGRRYQDLQAMLQNEIRAPFYMGECGDKKAPRCIISEVLFCHCSGPKPAFCTTVCPAPLRIKSARRRAGESFGTLDRRTR